MKMSRRIFMHYAWTGLASLGGLSSGYALGQFIPQTKPAEDWMNALMNSGTRGAEGALYLGRFVEPMYFLLEPINWTPNPGQEQYQSVTAPTGFVTDLASIPQIFWSLLRPDGEYAYAAILHDYLYWTQTRSRETADMIFKFSMQDFKVPKSTIATIYEAVRSGGGASWDNNSKLRRAGEKRVLKQFPNDPTTRWATWKHKAGVFTDL